MNEDVMSDEKSDDLQELIALYALDAVDATEAAKVERAVGSDPALRAELDAHRATLAVLFEHTEPAPSTPSPTVWTNIQAQVRGHTAPPVPDIASVADIRTSRRWARLGAFVAAAAVLASVALGVRVIDLQRQVDREATIDDVVAAAMADPSATVVDLVGQEGFEGQDARIVFDAAGVGYVVSHTLDPLDDAHTYQLWAVVADGGEQRVISAGVLGRNPSISQFQTDADVVGFAITAEIAGGVAVSEQPAVSLWLADA